MTELLDHGTANKRVSEIRAMSTIDAMVEVRRIIAWDCGVGLRIANRVVHDQGLLKQLFAEGIRVCNASTIRIYLERLVPRIGVENARSIIEQEAKLRPELPEFVRYWKP